MQCKAGEAPICFISLIFFFLDCWSSWHHLFGHSCHGQPLFLGWGRTFLIRWFFFPLFQGKWNSAAPYGHPSSPAEPGLRTERTVRVASAGWRLLLLRRRWSHSTSYSLWPSSSHHCQQCCCHGERPCWVAWSKQIGNICWFWTPGFFWFLFPVVVWGKREFCDSGSSVAVLFLLPLSSLLTMCSAEVASPTIPGWHGVLWGLPCWGGTSPPSCTFRSWALWGIQCPCVWWLLLLLLPVAVLFSAKLLFFHL